MNCPESPWHESVWPENRKITTSFVHLSMFSPNKLGSQLHYHAGVSAEIKPFELVAL